MLLLRYEQNTPSVAGEVFVDQVVWIPHVMKLAVGLCSRQASYLHCGSKPALFPLIFWPQGYKTNEGQLMQMIINYILRFAKPFLLSLKLSGSLWHCEDG